VQRDGHRQRDAAPAGSGSQTKVGTLKFTIVK
jgi:hypothetical protein